MVFDEQVAQELAFEGNSQKILAKIKEIGWKYYLEHEDDKLKSALFGLVTIRVRDLRFLFVILFGDPPWNHVSGTVSR